MKAGKRQYGLTLVGTRCPHCQQIRGQSPAQALQHMATCKPLPKEQTRGPG